MKRILILALLLNGILASAQTVTRKVGLAKGQQFEQQSHVKVSMSQEAMGPMMQMEGDITNLVEVKEAAASGFDVASTVKKMVMNMNAMGQDMKFDSDKKEDMEGNFGQALKGRINVPREFTVNKEGVITTVKTRADTEEPGGGMMGGMMSGALQAEKEGAAFHSLANIPAKGIKVGESWKDSTNDENGKTLTTYTLKEVKGNDGVVSISSNTSLSREVEQQGMTMQMEMTGTIVGEYVFDVATGIIKSRKATSKSSGTIDVAGQSMPVSLESTVESVVSKKS